MVYRPYKHAVKVKFFCFGEVRHCVCQRIVGYLPRLVFVTPHRCARFLYSPSEVGIMRGNIAQTPEFQMPEKPHLHRVRGAKVFQVGNKFVKVIKICADIGHHARIRLVARVNVASVENPVLAQYVTDDF